MIPLASAKNIKEIDLYTVTSLKIGLDYIIENAALSFFYSLQEEIDIYNTANDIIIICGPNNNGADGYAFAKLCYENNIPFKVIQFCSSKSDYSKKTINFLKSKKIEILLYGEESKKCNLYIKKSNIIIDAIFGVGYDTKRAPMPDFISIVNAINDSTAFKASIDIPSGISSDTGSFSVYSGKSIAIKADFTCTFIYNKPGLCSIPGIEYCGKQKIDSLFLTKSALNSTEYTNFLCDESVFDLMPKRNKNTNKGNFGKLISYCGSHDMPGAAVMATAGALRSGVGLLTNLCDNKTHNVLSTAYSEPIYINFDKTDPNVIKEKLLDKTAVLIGCGLGQSEKTIERVNFILENGTYPVILDADALNLLSQNKIKLNYKRKYIMTPHPGEMARLLNTSVQNIQNNRIEAAKKLSEKYNCITVLKGFCTIITDGKEIYINHTGNSGMSKGGFGDVLAGLIAGFVAQGICLLNSAILGVYIHGLSADKATNDIKQYSLLPNDLPKYILNILNIH